MQRSSPLWKSPSHASWLSNTSTSLLSTLSTQSKDPIRDRFLRTFSSLNLRYSIYRHVFVLEQTHAQPQNRVLTAFIPPDITQGRQLACDPLPPPSALSTYDATFFAGSEDPFALGATRSRRRTQAEERLLARLIPDAATRAQIVEFYDQNPWMAAQVPGGVVEFVQMMAEMPEDALQELMLDAAMMREAAGGDGADGAGVQPGLADRGAMPGELLGEEEENDVFWEAEEGGDVDGRGDTEEEDEEEDVEDVAVSVITRPSLLFLNLTVCCSRCLSVSYATSLTGYGEVPQSRTRPMTMTKMLAMNEHFF